MYTIIYYYIFIEKRMEIYLNISKATVGSEDECENYV